MHLLYIDMPTETPRTTKRKAPCSSTASWKSTQSRFGGDTQGLRNDLDYIQGLEIKV